MFLLVNLTDPLKNAGITGLTFIYFLPNIKRKGSYSVLIVIVIPLHHPYVQIWLFLTTALENSSQGLDAPRLTGSG